MDSLAAFALANTTTGFATLFAGLTCVALCRLVRRQAPAWHFVYWTVVVTGVFTVTLHGFGETVSGYGPRWFWGFLDTGSNILVAWAVALAALADYYPARARRLGRIALTIAMLGGVGWHFYDRYPTTERAHLIPLGDWGGFYPGESCLIALSFVAVGLFALKRREIPERARPLLGVVCLLFFVGMLLATAGNEQIVAPFFSIHALWHLVSAFAFVFLWAFNHVCNEVARDRAPLAAS